jgi:hypothetical protein
MKLIPTAYSGSCYLIHADSKRKENSIYIGYKDYLTKKNVPKQFTIYFTTNNDWHGIVNDKWVGYQYPLQIDTASHTFPLELAVKPLYREYYYSLGFGLWSKGPNQNKNSDIDPKHCFKTTSIMKLRNDGNCTEFCIPITFSALFDKSEIKICLKFVDHFCALDDIAHYINEQYFACMKPSIGKYYHGMASFRAGFSNFYPEIITEERLKRTLLYLHWGQSTQVEISEEKLIYGAYDLLAWIGGALGIFIGYSFFDFAKHIIDIFFHFIYEYINKTMTKKGLAQPNNVSWFQPELSKLGIISGFLGFTEFNPPKPEVSASGYSSKIARRHSNILHIQETQASKPEFVTSQ